MKVIDDDTNEQVEHNKGSDNDKNDEVNVGVGVVFRSRLLVNLKKIKERSGFWLTTLITYRKAVS